MPIYEAQKQVSKNKPPPLTTLFYRLTFDKLTERLQLFRSY